MGRLFLVRHAQASLLSENYDQLSTLGEQQARLLGEYWAHRNVVFDRVCSGPALRHQHTAQLVSDAYRKPGRDFPSPTIAAEFDEFQGEAVLSESLPQLLANNPTIRELRSVLQSSSDEAAKRANFQRLFEAVISMWVSGEIKPPTAESWPEFCARVNRGLSAVLVKSRKGEIAAIFTSGGPITVAVQRALHLCAQDTLRVAWVSRNCSYSEFLFSGERFMLSSFNTFSHLDDESLITYR
jgi:broad specificity phosphatase PhoE